MTWKHCGLNWNEQNLFGERREKLRNKTQNTNCLECFECESPKDDIEGSASNAFCQVTLLFLKNCESLGFSSAYVANFARLVFKKKVTRVLQTFSFTWTHSQTWMENNSIKSYSPLIILLKNQLLEILSYSPWRKPPSFFAAHYIEFSVYNKYLSVVFVGSICHHNILSFPLTHTHSHTHTHLSLVISVVVSCEWYTCFPIVK